MALGSLVAILALFILVSGANPVWFSVSSDDIAKRFKYSIFNPFRNRAPEDKAEHFLKLLKDGPCQQAYTLVQEPEERRQYTCEKEDKYKIQKWFLQYREDFQDRIVLDYRTWRQNEGKSGVHVGEPLRLTLKNQDGQWVITKFDTWY
jgi:hypothetical protein